MIILPGTLFYRYWFLLKRDTLSVHYEQRFLSCMAFSIYKVVCIACQLHKTDMQQMTS